MSLGLAHLGPRGRRKEGSLADSGEYTYRDVYQLAQADVRARLRVVGHCDLDCAFAQFEAKRLGWDAATEAVVVEQWGSLLAVSYPARAAGVTRMQNVTAARQVCPNLKSSHVPTYAPGARSPAYHDHPDPSTHKVSLDRYRRIGRDVAQAFRMLSGAEIQRAGTDEAYFDLSRPVHARLCELFPALAATPENLEQPLPPPPKTLDWKGRGAVIFPPDAGLDEPDSEGEDNQEAIPRPSALEQDSSNARATQSPGLSQGSSAASSASSVADNPPDLTPPSQLSSLGSGPQGDVTWGDVSLWIGAEIMSSVRAGVRGDPDLGYSTSAGVSRNKTMAKLGSSHQKPAGQTVVLGGAMGWFIGSHKVLKVPSLKGKLGSALCEEFGVDYVRELLYLSEEQLRRLDRVEGPMDAPWLHLLLRGVDYGAIVTEPASRSMLASKSLRPPIPVYQHRTEAAIKTWHMTLAAELCVRLTEARQDSGPTLTPSSLVLRAAVRTTGAPTYRSHQMPFTIPPTLGEVEPDSILPVAQRLWEQLQRDMPPVAQKPEITHVTMSFGGLHAPSAGQRSLQAFFQGGAAGRRAPSALAISAPPTAAVPPTPRQVAPSPPPGPVRLDQDFFASPEASSPGPAAARRPSSVGEAQVEGEVLCWTCRECGERMAQVSGGSSGVPELLAEAMLAQERQSHEDFHMAQRLQAEDGPVPLPDRKRPPKRRKRTLQTFFPPRA